MASSCTQVCVPRCVQTLYLHHTYIQQVTKINDAFQLPGHFYLPHPPTVLVFLSSTQITSCPLRCGLPWVSMMNLLLHGQTAHALECMTSLALARHLPRVPSKHAEVPHTLSSKNPTAIPSPQPLQPLFVLFSCLSASVHTIFLLTTFPVLPHVTRRPDKILGGSNRTKFYIDLSHQTVSLELRPYTCSLMHSFIHSSQIVK